MNEIWVLSVRTSLPKVCYAFGDMNLNMQCFDSFEKAKAAFRESLKSFAFTAIPRQTRLRARDSFLTAATLWTFFRPMPNIPCALNFSATK